MFSIAFFALAFICFGAIHCDTVQYWISKALSSIRKGSPLTGSWQLTHDRNGVEITEHIEVHAPFADVAYGDLRARLQDGNTAPYRARLEHQFDNIYSVVLKPAPRSQVEIGMGVIELDFESRIASGRIINATRERLDAGEKLQMREVAIRKKA